MMMCEMLYTINKSHYNFSPPFLHLFLSTSLSPRRQKARERQQKLLAEFASRQKSFMETAMDVGEFFFCFFKNIVLHEITSKNLVPTIACDISPSGQ